MPRIDRSCRVFSRPSGESQHQNLESDRAGVATCLPPVMQYFCGHVIAFCYYFSFRLALLRLIRPALRKRRVYGKHVSNVELIVESLVSSSVPLVDVRIRIPHANQPLQQTLLCLPHLQDNYRLNFCLSLAAGFAEVESALPFVVEGHQSAKSPVAKEMLRRLKEDVQYFSNEVCLGG